tara:strand:+ start:7436 stop:8524 length:1089 start_codon:yes stop_codon:yes gene_type:complete
MSRFADTRIHILIRGAKGSGKNVLIDLFCAENTGILWNIGSELGIGFRTMIGANSITEAGMFGSVNEDGAVVGRPLAREMCGGFLCFEEYSAMNMAGHKEHSTDMINQLLTSLDSGRVNKGMKNGWVRYHTRYTLWAGTQPARFELESGLDRRLFIIDIAMNPEREARYKRAQNAQANMSAEERVELADMIIGLREWFVKKMTDSMLNPPKGIHFHEDVEEWIMQESVRSFEADLFRRLAIGYHIMKGTSVDGEGIIQIDLDEKLMEILNISLVMRREVMDADLALIKNTFWKTDLARSTLLKEVAKMITAGDYQTAKRWVEENLIPQKWYREYIPDDGSRKGRKGVVCRFGFTDDEGKLVG